MNLKIRKMKNSDLESLYKLLSDSKVMKFLEEPYDKAQTLDFLTNAGMSEPPLVYAVDKDDDFIGYVIFHDYDDLSYEIGWVLYPCCWGKGYASHLTELMIEKAFEINKEVVIECDPKQEATKHIALKYGFQYEGVEDDLEVYRLRKKDISLL